jgi:hypothetical protein
MLQLGESGWLEPKSNIFKTETEEEEKQENE